MRFFNILFIIIFSTLLISCKQEELKTYIITIQNHHFIPEKIYVEPNIRFKLIVKNMDPTVEEFESHSLNREKIIAGNSEIIVFLGPLKEGTYNFFGEFHEKTAQGELIVTKASKND